MCALIANANKKQCRSNEAEALAGGATLGAVGVAELGQPFRLRKTKSTEPWRGPSTMKQRLLLVATASKERLT